MKTNRALTMLPPPGGAFDLPSFSAVETSSSWRAVAQTAVETVRPGSRK